MATALIFLDYKGTLATSTLVETTAFVSAHVAAETSHVHGHGVCTDWGRGGDRNAGGRQRHEFTQYGRKNHIRDTYYDLHGYPLKIANLVASREEGVNRVTDWMILLYEEYTQVLKSHAAQ